MSRQWAQKKSGSNSSMSVQKSSSSQRPLTAPVYDAPAPKQTPSVQAKRRNVDWNRVTVEAQSPAGVQAKLSVGAPGDKYEQEADAMANKVMTMPAPENAKPLQREMAPEEKEEEVQTKPLADSIQREMAPEEKEEEVQTKPLADSIQREMAPEEKEEEVQTKPLANSIQREMAPEEKEEEVQTKPLADSIQREMVPEEKEEEVQTKPATGGKSQAGSNLESQLSGTKGGGSALSDEVRSHMEPRFGANFSSVRVHTDGAAVQMNKDLSAQAFTHGSDIYYGGGKSPGKDELTAHELTHVVQQNGGAVAPGGKAITQPARHDPKAVSLAHSFDNHTATKPIQRVGATEGQERKKKPDQEPIMLGALDGERPIRSPSPGSSPRASIDSNTSGTKGKDKGKGKERASAGLSNKGSNDSMTKGLKDPAKDSRGAKAGPSNRSNETMSIKGMPPGESSGDRIEKARQKYPKAGELLEGITDAMPDDQKVSQLINNITNRNFNYTGRRAAAFSGAGDCGTLVSEVHVLGKAILADPNTITGRNDAKQPFFIRNGGQIIGDTRPGNVENGRHWLFAEHHWIEYKGEVIDVLFRGHRGQRWIRGERQGNRYRFGEEIYSRAATEDNPQTMYCTATADQETATADQEVNNERRRRNGCCTIL